MSLSHLGVFGKRRRAVSISACVQVRLMILYIVRTRAALMSSPRVVVTAVCSQQTPLWKRGSPVLAGFWPAKLKRYTDQAPLPSYLQGMSGIFQL